MFLVPALLLAVLSSLRLCRLAAASDPLLTGASAPGRSSDGPSRPPEPVEAAYLAGGPERVVDVTLVDMTGRGLLHIAHTGWTSVARPLPGTELESEVIAALGPDGQRRTDEVRREVAHGPSVGLLARSLAELGLAVTPGSRAAMAQAVTAVRVALLATVALGTTALGAVGARDLLTGAHDSLLAPAAWFVLPLILTAGTLLMARAEFHPVTPWAAPAGQQLLRALRPQRRTRDPLLTLVLRGPKALRDQRLRTALTVRSRKR
ncbi:TIGR04222 domain-containing membrane protein [Streptacidiphilus sp. MAP12-33]|uniref:TIGR04222 domain-containing membrane protein n=1 Tax=Streptacidiphilus sp. MAP12-33 TaxID=3156266 RepID=UPI003512156C